MFNLIRNVASYAAPENYQAIANVYNRVAEAFTPSSSKVEKISASKLNSLAKCDSSMVFSIYSERTASPIFYVIYLPRMLIVFRSQVKADADLIRSSFSNLSKLINALENHSESDFVCRMDRLRKSVEENPSFGVIHHASACDFADAITKICSQSDAQVVVNEASIDGRFPLQIAADHSSEESLRVLIRFGADLSKQDSKLRNVLHYAAEKSPKVLQILKASDRFEIAMNQIDEDGMTPLCKAIQASQIDSVKLLLDSGCSKGPFPAGPIAAILTLADNSSNRLPELVDTIAKRCPNFLFERIHGTSTILHEEMDKALLYHILEGVGQTLDVNVRDGLKQTPLHCAVRRGSLEQTIALLAFGCDVNAVDEDGDTALHIAIQLGYIFIVKLLLCFHSSVTIGNKHGLKALDAAVQSSSSNKKEIVNCVRLITERSSDSKEAPENVIDNMMQSVAISRITSLPVAKRARLINVLSLDGGGIRGLILVQILLHIENELGYPVMSHFKWLAGTSTGAILALALARGDSLRLCQGLYLRLKDDIFKGKKPYSDKTIEYFLQNHFGNSLSMAQIESRRVMVTATSVKKTTPELKLYRNYCLPLDRKQNEALGYMDPKHSLVWKCARYSSAAPTFFTPKDDLVDGGLMSNNPTLDLLTDIHTYNAACQYSDSELVDIGCVLSVGTGQCPSSEVGSSKFAFGTPGSINEGISMIRDLMNLKNILIEQITSSGGECVKRARSWAHDQKIAFFRLSPPLSKAVELDESDNEVIVDFLWDTEKYLNTSGRAQVQTLVAYLRCLQS